MLRLKDTPAPQRGGKGDSLAWLEESGLSIPQTWVVPPGSDPAMASFAEDRTYAVRSSANVEDGASASFAGQFETLLDVSAADVVDAIAAVRASASTVAVDSYQDRMHSSTSIRMSVLIQEMIDPVASGVVFTRNPITGLNETILEAVSGTGDKLVQGGVTPDRWVRRWGAWITKPGDGVLPDALAEEIAERATVTAEKYGAPADLEWVWDGTDLWWLQIRPITGDDDVAIYSNRISREFLPGIIKPLVWSVNVPVVNKAWLRLITEAIGPNDLEPSQLARTFAYRSYFNMGAFGDIFELVGMRRDSLELLIGLPAGPDQPKMKPTARTMAKTPRLVGFAVGRSRFAGSIEPRLDDMLYRYRTFDRDLSDLQDDELFAAIDDLMELTSEAAYANIVVPLLANLSSSLLRRMLARYGIDLEQVDISIEGSPDLADPNSALDGLARIIQDHGAESSEADERLEAFLGEFGHFSDSGNDFSIPTWSEQPDLVRRMAAARSASASARPQRWDEAVADLGLLSTRAAEAVRSRAWTYQLRRDRVSSLYTYGYGLFRDYFLEIGERLAQRKLIDTPDDVMYLSLSEVRSAMSGQMEAERIRSVIAGHISEIERVRDIEMPEVIYGDEFSPVEALSHDGILEGVASSRGHYRGPVRVVNGLADFDKVEEGDVLAIPFSDVGWTPLFASAGAVIAESGGLLSHSSIVAREYGIPCVVSVAGATRLDDGAIVSVDGYTGTVVVE